MEKVVYAVHSVAFFLEEWESCLWDSLAWAFQTSHWSQCSMTHEVITRRDREVERKGGIPLVWVRAVARRFQGGFLQGGEAHHTRSNPRAELCMTHLPAEMCLQQFYIYCVFHLHRWGEWIPQISQPAWKFKVNLLLYGNSLVWLLWY